MSLLRQVFAWMHDATGNAIGSNAGALKVALHDASGNPISSLMGAINIHDADVHRETINRQFHQHSTPSTTLSVEALAGNTSITVTSATGFAIGMWLHIEGDNVENVHPKITNIVGNVITIDRPLDWTHPIGSTVDNSLLNMNVVGGLASPQSFIVVPKPGEVWHLKKLSIAMIHSSAGDFGLFGNLTALTNGVALRRYDGLTGHFDTFTIWRSNGTIDEDMGTVKFVTRSGGGGSYGTAAQGYFDDTGTVVYLNGDNGDYLEVLVQDDLSGLASFKMKAQGHSEG